MHYDGPPKHKVPAPQYDLYIKAFEKEVAAAQGRIEQLRAMENLYNIIRECLVAAKIPQHNILRLGATEVVVDVRLSEDDTLDDVNGLVDLIGKTLVSKNLREELIGTKSTYSTDMTFAWRVGSAKDKIVTVVVEFPGKGTRDYLLRPKTESYTYKSHTLEQREARLPRGWHKMPQKVYSAAGVLPDEVLF